MFLLAPFRTQNCWINDKFRKINERSSCFSCTHSEVMCDGTANVTFSFNGRLAFDISRKVDLRWRGLSAERKNTQ